MLPSAETNSQTFCFWYSVNFISTKKSLNSLEPLMPKGWKRSPCRQWRKIKGNFSFSKSSWATSDDLSMTKSAVFSNLEKQRWIGERISSSPIWIRISSSVFSFISESCKSSLPITRRCVDEQYWFPMPVPMASWMKWHWSVLKPYWRNHSKSNWNE